MTSKKTLQDFSGDTVNLEEWYEFLSQFDWWQDMERMERGEKHTKWISGEPGKRELKPAPVNLVLTVMKDSASRPEILAAYGSVGENENIPPAEKRLLREFNRYLRHKYGNESAAVSESYSFMRYFANHKYESLEDPALKADLLKKSFILEDDGVNYDC